jgi:small subunit ribosomal protein S8
MTMNDLVADMLTRTRNALHNRRETVDVIGSKLNIAIGDVLKREGYILDSKVLDTKPQATLKLYLKYGPEGEDVIAEIQRESSAGCRIYSGVEDLGTVKHGLGIYVVSTPNGVLSDRECRKQRVGGEVLCRVW